MVLALALAVAGLAACGDDGGAQQPPNAPATPRPGAPGATGPKPPPLPERLHVEDRVTCPVPARPTDPKAKCDLKAPSCPEHLYCLQLAAGSFCEPCPERDGIRHPFKERDFAADQAQNRDPFQSFLLPQLTIGKRTETMAIDPTKKCPREDQMVATSYSYTDLKLVGIVAQGTQRKVLMMGGSLGYIIKRGDCVGKEKAFVKDIGTGYITFVLDPDTVSNTRSPEEFSVQLNPKQLAVNGPELPIPVPRTPITPVVPPSAVLPRSPAGVVPGAGAAGAGPASGAVPASGGTVAAPVTSVPVTIAPATSPPIVSPPGASPPVVSPPGTQPTLPQTMAPIQRF
jgi:Tfp pilus assembly protein PilP